MTLRPGVGFGGTFTDLLLVSHDSGGGQWRVRTPPNDRLERPVEAVVCDDSFGLVSREKALAGYGVVLIDEGNADLAATEAERARQAAARGAPLAFDFGSPLEEMLANCKNKTGTSTGTCECLNRR